MKPQLEPIAPERVLINNEDFAVCSTHWAGKAARKGSNNPGE